MAPQKTENNAYLKFWGDKQRAFMVCYGIFCSGQFRYVICSNAGVFFVWALMLNISCV